MRSLILATLVFFCGSAFASGEQIATLLNFESTAARPTTDYQTGSMTSIGSAMMEYTSPSNISLYGGFAFAIGDNPESSLAIGSRYYSASPAFQILPGVPMWSFIGGGIDFFSSSTVYYPEAGFRVATSNASRLDVFVKFLNSSSPKYDKHVMVGAGLTF